MKTVFTFLVLVAASASANVLTKATWDASAGKVAFGDPSDLDTSKGERDIDALKQVLLDDDSFSSMMLQLRGKTNLSSRSSEPVEGKKSNDVFSETVYLRGR